MNPLSFTAFDTETANRNSSSICQIGFVIVKNEQIVTEQSYLIQPPGNNYDVYNSCIHGIDSLRTKDQPCFPEIWERIKEHFIDNLLVAHNASFDLRIIYSALDYYKISKPILNCDCTFTISGLSLKALSESLQIAVTRHHDALTDAKTCALAYLQLKKGKTPNMDLIIESEPDSIFDGHNRLKGDVLKPIIDVDNPCNPFYSKKIVFTGVLNSITREEAASKLQKLGADIDTGVNKRTDFVIVGYGAGPSKIKKIQDFNASGSNIRIINEDEFLAMKK